MFSKFKLFADILVLCSLYTMSKYPALDLNLLFDFVRVYMLLYGLVLISNLTATLAIKVTRGIWNFSWREIQSAKYLIFFSSLLFAFLQVGNKGLISFLLAFSFIYLSAVFLWKVIQKFNQLKGVR